MPSLKDFKNLAKERGLQRYHNLKKEELAKILNIPISPSKKDLKNLAKERGLRGFHNLKKDELSRLLERPIPAPRTKRRDFSERPIPAPRTKKPLAPRPIPDPITFMNIRNPSISAPILQPEKVEAKQSEAPRPIPAPRTKKEIFLKNQFQLREIS